jgi:hypothetical protein
VTEVFVGNQLHQFGTAVMRLVVQEDFIEVICYDCELGCLGYAVINPSAWMDMFCILLKISTFCRGKFTVYIVPILSDTFMCETFELVIENI